MGQLGVHPPVVSQEALQRPRKCPKQAGPISLDDAGWDILLQSVRKGKCTPFLGAGACMPPLPSGTELAKEWAAEYDYPLPDSGDLARVAQFIAVTRNSLFAKEKIDPRFKSFAQPNPLHYLLADLDLPIYITTNYDDLMFNALTLKGKRPVRELCRWNKSLKSRLTSVFDDPHFEASKDTPVVFHLHGHQSTPESMVLTEDDYVDFLINLAPGMLPPRIEEAFAGASLLFLGYRLADWNFRVLFRSMVTYMEISMQRTHVSVQLGPSELPKAMRVKALEYLNKYFDKLYIRVYWGECLEFAQELRDKLDQPSGLAAGRVP